jgi:hypothetical protein
VLDYYLLSERNFLCSRCKWQGYCSESEIGHKICSLGKRDKERIAHFLANPIETDPGFLLPVRTRPKARELFSSWLVRLSSDNGISVSCFAGQVLGVGSLTSLGIIDSVRIPGFWERLSALTGIPVVTFRKMTFYGYRWTIPGIVPTSGDPSYAFMALHGGYRTTPHGLRNSGAYSACIECWREDPTPYIRKSWRQRYTTVCAKHRAIHATACNRCGQHFSASFSTRFASGRFFNSELPICRYCGADIRDQNPPLYGSDGHFPLDTYLEIEEIYDRSFERGWFSLIDSTRLLAGTLPECTPWDTPTSWRVPRYPYISSSCLVLAFQKAFNRWIIKEFGVERGIPKTQWGRYWNRRASVN